MRTTKAYLAGLGTTGILIASVLALMVVGTGFVAFQGLSDVGSPSRPLHRVVVEDDGFGPEAARRARDREGSSLLPLFGAERLRLGSRQQLATERRAAGRREAARRRDARGRSQRSGGAEVPAGDVLGGGAGARTGDAGGAGSLPGGSGGPSGGSGGSGGPSGGQPGGGGGAPGPPPAGGGGSGGFLP